MPKTLKQFGEFLNRKDVGFNCPLCGHPEWNVEGDGTESDNNELGLIEAPVFQEDESIGLINIDKKYLLFYVMTCRKCGFVRLHNQKVVDEDDQP